MDLVAHAADNDEIYEILKPKVIEKVVLIIMSLEKKEHKQLESNILALVECEEKYFGGLKEYKHVFSLGLNLLQTRKITFNKVFNIVEEYFSSIEDENM